MTLKLSEAASRACDFKLEIRDDQRAAQVDAGNWWMLPIGRTHSNVIWGLRIMPGASRGGWPFMQASEGNANTLAAGPGLAVPHMLLERMRTPGDWDSVVKGGDALWRELEALHQHLGGQQSLDAFRRVVSNDQVKLACVDPSRPVTSRISQQVATQVAVDPTPGLKVKLEYALGVVVNGDAPWPPRDAGVFAHAVAVMAFITNRTNEDAKAEALAAWEVVQSPPSIDPQDVNGVGYFSTLASDGGETALEAAKTCLRQKAHAGDPLWPAQK